MFILKMEKVTGWVGVCFGLGILCSATALPGVLFPSESTIAAVLIALVVTLVGVRTIEHSYFIAATRAVTKKAVICGLNKQDWQFDVLIVQGRIIAPNDQEERMLSIAPIRITRPDDMPQFHWAPVREEGRTNGKIIAAKILGVIYDLPQ